MKYQDERRNFTIYANVSLPERIKQLAEARNLSMADLSNWLLLYAVEEMENGRLEPETKVVRRIITNR